MKKNIPALFGSMVFSDAVMRERLPKGIYESLHRTIAEGKDLDTTSASVVAAAMRDWAIEKGATHFTHWFLPMTGVTAEKHDSFISPQGECGVIMDFGGKELIKGEPDASSFPSGGLRATFEARGYTAWDPTSYAFIKDDSLCIPTVFCSYSGEVLDQKTPLMRSVEALNKQCLRILPLFGMNDVTRVTPRVGAEQEYFLLDKTAANRRWDLVLTGHTLVGARPPKGQELDDHYYSAIAPRVMDFMQDLNEELWKVGVYAKTEHNEVAPAQHELAPIYTDVNRACDHNQLTMELMKKVADRHGLVCLLHEKPFAGLNGSGKHNNWSIVTDTGLNLFKPGKEPAENKLFLLMLTAVIRAVDEYAPLLRISVASPGNDYRLGGNEAPPAIISLFLGDKLTAILAALEKGEGCVNMGDLWMGTGVGALPELKKDTTDRNRTSPFAFTGNKFEFRSPGSAASIADVNTVLNTILADVLHDFADELEGKTELPAAIDALLRKTLTEHKRIVFNGNNYAKAWLDEAQKRGLANLPTTVDALSHYLDEKNVALFRRNGILSETELRSRHDIMLDHYIKTTLIDAQTLHEMGEREILPAAFACMRGLSEGVSLRKSLGLASDQDADYGSLIELTERTNALHAALDGLAAALNEVRTNEDPLQRAELCRDRILPAMALARSASNALETRMPEKDWPFPSYAELLFRS